MTDNNSTTNENGEQCTVSQLEEGDEVYVDEIAHQQHENDTSTIQGRNFVPPTAETCIVHKTERMPHENYAVTLCSEDGFHGMVQKFDIEKVTVLSKDNEYSTTVIGDIDRERQKPELDFRSVGIGLQKIGHAIKMSGRSSTYFVYDTIMNNDWYYAMALGKDGEVETIHVKHDTGSCSTAQGYRSDVPPGYDDESDQSEAENSFKSNSSEDDIDPEQEHLTESHEDG